MSHKSRLGSIMTLEFDWLDVGMTKIENDWHPLDMNGNYVQIKKKWHRDMYKIKQTI